LDVRAFTCKELQVQMASQKVAVVRSILHWESTYRGKPWNADFLMSDVWIAADNRWQLIYRHSSYPASQLPRIISERYARPANAEACNPPSKVN
jgi:hypothetical protein